MITGTKPAKVTKYNINYNHINLEFCYIVGMQGYIMTLFYSLSALGISYMYVGFCLRRRKLMES